MGLNGQTPADKCGIMIEGKTPSEACGITIKGDNKWLTLIQNAKHEHK